MDLPSFTHKSQHDKPAARTFVLTFLSGVMRAFSEAKVDIHPEGGSLRVSSPVRVMGKGRIEVRGTVSLGVYRSPRLFDGIYLEARTESSSIFIDDGTHINNGSSIISEGASIRFGKRCLVGPSLFCADSNFHELAVERRNHPDSKPAPVVIEDDVFIGEGVRIMKGVHIGAGSVVASGAVLFPGFSCPPGSVVLGNPAVVRSSGGGTLE